MKRYLVIRVGYQDILAPIDVGSEILGLLPSCSIVESKGYGEDEVFTPKETKFDMRMISEDQLAKDIFQDPATRSLFQEQKEKFSKENRRAYKAEGNHKAAIEEIEKLRADVLELVNAPQNAVTMRKRISELLIKEEEEAKG